MEYSSSYYWSALKDDFNKNSITIQGITSKTGEFYMACLCSGTKGGNHLKRIASGYAAEEMTKWFYREGILLHQKKQFFYRGITSIKRQIFRMEENIEKFSKQLGEELECEMMILIIDYRNYYIVGTKNRGIIHLNHRRKKQRMTGPANRKSGIIVKQGLMKNHHAFLLFSDEVEDAISTQTLYEIFQSCYSFPKDKIEKYVKETGIRTERRTGKKEGTIIYVRKSKGNS